VESGEFIDVSEQHNATIFRSQKVNQSGKRIKQAANKANTEAVLLLKRL
jgi:hypothetical protein